MTDTHGDRQAQPIPSGYYTVTPWIISRDTAQLLQFLKNAFDAVELARIYVEGGKIGHAEARIGDSMLMMFDAGEGWPETPAFNRLFVEDANAVYKQALAAGATAVTEVTHLAFGDRVGRVRDPLGNIWWLQTHVEDLSFEEMGRRAEQPQYADAMQYVQQSLDAALRGASSTREQP